MNRQPGALVAIVLGALAFPASACQFQVAGIPIDGEPDFASLAMLDLGPDLAKPGFVPAHVAPTHVQEGAASLGGIIDIDTESFRLNGNPPPAGVLFMAEATHPEWAVLSVRDFTAAADVKIHGGRAFLLIATGEVKLDAVMHAEAVLRVPGPGGQFTGMGVGGDGKSNGPADSGGGGAGHGVVGAAGGDSMATTNNQGGAGGGVYTPELAGGSGGGNGAGLTPSFPAQPCPANQGWSAGGAGGGVVQISAKLNLDISETGGINVGGGGGRGGCGESASSGGGGGSGGTIWLESPTMRIVGRLAANGGGGGSGGRNSVTQDDGNDGQGGRLDLMPAAGGPRPPGSGGGAGGAGGVLNVDAAPGQKETNGGGGGGAVGRIRLRTRAVSPTTAPGTVLSPAPEKTVDF